MRHFSTSRIALTLAACALPAAAWAGSITGTATYDGKVPNLRPLSMDADPKCAEKHDGPVANEMLVLGEGNTMANIFVKVTNPPSGDFPAPSDPVVMDQNGCVYEPHVMGVQVGQPFKILNSDALMHNVHALPKKNKEFNMAMPPNRTEATEKFATAEGMFKIKCDVHPWMTAWVAVVPHPFFDTTEADGKFEIADLPAGKYTVEAWHEKLGTRTAEVEVPDEGSASVDFSFATPK